MRVATQCTPLLPWQWLTLCFCAGIWTSRYHIPGSFAAGLLTMGCVLSFSSKKLRLCSCLLATIIGFFYGHITTPPPQPPIPQYILQGKKIHLTATVDRLLPTTDKRLRIILRNVLVSIHGKKHPLKGNIVWTWQYPHKKPAPGQQVTTTLRIKPVHGFKNPHTWNSKQYWHDQGVYWRAWSRGKEQQILLTGEPSFFWQYRQTLYTAVIKALGTAKSITQEQAVIPALLFGDRFFFSRHTLEQLSLASLSHSIAISGMHLGIIVAVGMFFAWFPAYFFPQLYEHIPRKKLGLLCAAPFVILYTWIGGASPSLIRAALMFFCWGIFVWRGQGRVLLDGLFLAVLCMLLVHPLAIFDLRLQLSALAVLSISFCLPWLTTQFPPAQALVLPEKRSRHALNTTESSKKLATYFIPFALRHPQSYSLLRSAVLLLGTSFCIQITLLPITLWNFGYITPWFILNLLWMPLVSIWTLPCIFIGAALVLFPFPTVSSAFFSAACFPVHALFYLLEHMQHTKLLTPTLSLRPAWPAILGYWCLLSCIPVTLQNFSLNSKLRYIIISVGIVLLAFPAMQRFIEEQSSTIQLHAIDVGQGQSIVIDVPHGKRVLIDGGGFSSRTFDVGKAIVGPVLTYNNPPYLNAIINTHPDTDHIRGLFYPIAHFSPTHYYTNGDTGGSWNEQQLRYALKQSGISAETLVAGDSIPLTKDTSLRVLHPPANTPFTDRNNAGLVLKLEKNGEGLALIMGDVEKEGIEMLLHSGADLHAEVLIVAHHGAASSLSPILYDRVHPKQAIACTGYLNRWHFPSPKVCNALRQRGIPLDTTAEQGHITIKW